MHDGAERRMVEARVRAGGVDTPYQRMGRGPTLLLLVDEAEPLDRTGNVVEVLARDFRVIRPRLVPSVWSSGRRSRQGAPTGTPTPMAPGITPFQWLRGLIEGLGLERPGLVLGPSVARTLEPFPSRHPDEIGAWVVLDHRTLSDLGTPASLAALKRR